MICTLIVVGEMYLFAVILCINCTSVWVSAKPFISFFESSATLSILACSIPVLPKFRTNQKSSRTLIFCAKVTSGEKWNKSEAFGGFSHARLFFPMEHISIWPMRVVRSASKLPHAARPQSTRVSKRAV